MTTKNVSVDFFKLDSNDIKKSIQKLSTKLAEQKKDIASKKRSNIKIFDFHVRFAHLELSNNVWFGHLEKVRTEEYAVVGDLAGSRNTFAINQDEGPVNDTTFFFWPSYGIIGIYRLREGVSHKSFVIFLDKLLSDEVKLNIILGEDQAKRLDKMRLVKKMEYKISRPNNAKFLKDENTGFFQEAKLIEQLNSNSMDIIIAAGKGKKLEKEQILKKARRILNHNDKGIKVDKMKIIGRQHHDAVEETIDLIEDRMVYKEKLTIPKNKKVTPEMMIDVVQRAYADKRTELARMYIDEE